MLGRLIFKNLKEIFLNRMLIVLNAAMVTTLILSVNSLTIGSSFLLPQIVAIFIALIVLLDIFLLIAGVANAILEWRMYHHGLNFVERDSGGFGIFAGITFLLAMLASVTAADLMFPIEGVVVTDEHSIRFITCLTFSIFSLASLWGCRRVWKQAFKMPMSA